MAALAFGGAFLWPTPYLRESHRILHAAYDCGFRHFDVAPSYCHGWSEYVLGSANLPRDATFATKTGLFPGATSRAKGVAFAFLRRMGARPKRVEITRGNRSQPQFSIAAMERYLRSSRTALRRDTLDILLLHEARGDDVPNEVLEWLMHRVERGEIRTFGAGTRLDDLERLAERNVLPIWQYKADEMLRTLGMTRNPAQTHITHGVFGAFKGFVLDHMAAAANVDPMDEVNINKLCLATAFEMNRNGSVLIATRKISHLTSAAGVLSDAALRAKASTALKVYLQKVQVTP